MALENDRTTIAVRGKCVAYDPFNGYLIKDTLTTLFQNATRLKAEPQSVAGEFRSQHE